MKALLHRVWRSFCSGFRPVAVGAQEALGFRLLFAVVVWFALPKNLDYESVRDPHGLANFIDLGFLLKGDVYQWFRYATLACLAVYVAGVGLALVLPLLTILHVLPRTVFNSQGYIHHGYQMIGCLLLAQSLVVLFFVGYRMVKGHRFPMREEFTQWSYLFYYSQGVVAACYVLPALTKLDRSDGGWIWNSPNLAKHLLKTEKQHYYNKLDETILGTQSWIAEWMLAHPMLARLFAGSGLLLELAAILALWNRAWALGIGLSLIAFHWGIGVTMGLHFKFNEYAIWIFLINVPFWLLWAWGKIGGKKDGRLRAW